MDARHEEKEELVDIYSDILNVVYTTGVFILGPLNAEEIMKRSIQWIFDQDTFKNCRLDENGFVFTIALDKLNIDQLKALFEDMVKLSINALIEVAGRDLVYEICAPEFAHLLELKKYYFEKYQIKDLFASI
jgi:hypothetical protein